MTLCIRFKTFTPALEHDDVGRTGVGGVLTASVLRAESSGVATAGTAARFGGRCLRGNAWARAARC